MKVGHPAYKSATYRRIRQAWLATQPIPWRCQMERCTCPAGRTIDHTLSGRERWGINVEHTTARIDDPTAFLDTARWKLAHRACNSRAGAQIGNARRWGGKPSRDW